MSVVCELKEFKKNDTGASQQLPDGTSKLPSGCLTSTETATSIRKSSEKWRRSFVNRPVSAIVIETTPIPEIPSR